MFGAAAGWREPSRRACRTILEKWQCAIRVRATGGHRRARGSGTSMLLCIESFRELVAGREYRRFWLAHYGRASYHFSLSSVWSACSSCSYVAVFLRHLPPGGMESG